MTQEFNNIIIVSNPWESNHRDGPVGSTEMTSLWEIILALHNTSTILVEFINTYWLVMLVTGEGVSQ